MKRMFFLILILVIWFIPAIVGCATGGSSHTRPANGDAGRASSDAGQQPPLSHDAGTIEFDAWHSAGVSDASRPAPDAYVAAPDPGESHVLRISLSSALRSQCPAGWRIRLWLTDPPVESTRGLDLELHIPVLTRFGPWSSLTLWCDERSPQWFDWNASDRSASGSGLFSELSLDGVDLRPSTMLCADPLSPGTGPRPILMWDATNRGRCPPL